MGKMKKLYTMAMEGEKDKIKDFLETKMSKKMTSDDKFWQIYEEYCKMKQDEVVKEDEPSVGSETGIELEPGYEN